MKSGFEVSTHEWERAAFVSVPGLLHIISSIFILTSTNDKISFLVGKHHDIYLYSSNFPQSIASATSH